MRQSKSCPVVSLNVRVQVWYDVYMKAGGKAKRAFGSPFFGLPCLRLLSCLLSFVLHTITSLILTGARGRSSFGRVEKQLSRQPHKLEIAGAIPASAPNSFL